MSNGFQKPFSRINFLEASALFLLLLILSATMAQAQVLYGTISGNVTDSSGAVVAGGQVVVLEVQTGVSQKATTDSNGLYTGSRRFCLARTKSLSAPQVSPTKKQPTCA